MAVHRTPSASRRRPGLRPASAAFLAGVLAAALLVVPAVGAQQPDPTSSTLPPLQEQRPLPSRDTNAPTTPVGRSDEPAPSTAPTPSTGPAATEVIPKGEGLNNALPRPNSGHAPEYQGDRGTGSQYAVLGAMLLAFAVIAGLVVRQSRRSRLRWSASAPMAGAPRAAPPGTDEVGSLDGSGADEPGSDAP